MNFRRIVSPIPLTFCLILSCYYNAVGQDSHITDSLNLVIHGNFQDTVKIDAYIAMAGEYYGTDPKEAIRYCDSARALSIHAQANGKLTSSLGWLAYLHEQTGDLQKAVEYNKEAFDLAQKEGNKKNQAILLNNIAAILKDQGELDTAITLDMQSLALRKEIHDTAGIATSYNNIALIYQGQGRVRMPSIFFQKLFRHMKRSIMQMAWQPHYKI